MKILSWIGIIMAGLGLLGGLLILSEGGNGSTALVVYSLYMAISINLLKAQK
jgi:hypothetical protein